jgi:hypothetical protein
MGAGTGFLGSKALGSGGPMSSLVPGPIKSGVGALQGGIKNFVSGNNLLGTLTKPLSSVGNFLKNPLGMFGQGAQQMSLSAPAKAMDLAIDFGSKASTQGGGGGGLMSNIMNAFKSPLAQNPMSTALMTGAQRTPLLTGGTAMASTGANAAQGGISGLLQSMQKFNPFTSGGTGIGGAISNLFKGGAGSAAASPTSTALSSLGTSSPFMPLPLGAPVGNGFNVGAGRLIQQAVQPAASGGFFGNLMNTMKSNPLIPLGLGISAFSQFYPKKPAYPEMPESFEELRQMAESGTPEGELAKKKLTEMMNQPLEQMTSEEEAAITKSLNDNYNKEVEGLRDLYRNIRPGSDPSSDSSFRRDLAEIDDRYARSKSDLLATARRGIRSEFNSNRMNQIAQALGIANMDMNSKMAIANADAQWIMNKFNLNYQDATNLKNFLLQEGTQLFNYGVAPQQQSMNPLLMAMMMGQMGK